MIPNPAVIAFAAVAAFGLGFTGGYTFAWSRQEAVIQTMKADEAKRREAAVAAALKADRAAQAVSAAVDKGAVEAQERIRTVYRTITKKVTVYVTAKSDTACVVPRGFVELHDAAAAGRPLPVPAAPGDLDDPSGVPLSSVAGTTAENYGVCHETAGRLNALQSWIREQAAIAP